MGKRWGSTRLPLRQSCFRYSLLVVLMLCLVAIVQPLVLAQIPGLPTTPATQPLPPGVERRGTLESAPIRLDGKTLFRVAAPMVLNRNEPGSQLPIEVRAKQIETNLERLIPGHRLSDELTLDLQTLEVVVETLNGQPVLFVKDATLAEPRGILTVTDPDAQYAALSKNRLAEQWREIVQTALQQALELRQPEAVQEQIATAIQILIAILVVTTVLGITWELARRQQKQLEQLLAAEAEVLQQQESLAAESSSPEPKGLLFPALRAHFGLQQRLQLIRLLRWLLFWGIVLIWMVGTAHTLQAFPQTRQFARQVVTIPVMLLLSWFLSGLTNRLTDFSIDRYLQIREQEQSLTEGNLRRIATIARVIKGLKMVLIYTVALLWLLQWLNLVPGSLLTVGALLALVVSLAAQNLVKDLVNGFLILLEDQFRIGDNVRIGNLTGVVENLNLRITQIRSNEGNLITLPNSLITQVENRSRSWARADVQVEIAYHSDIDQALAVIQTTTKEMAEDPQWSSFILNPQELLGVDQISHTGIVIRIWIRTAPAQQWAIGRELRRRLKMAFDQHQIQIGIPQQLYLNSDGLNDNQSPNEPSQK